MTGRERIDKVTALIESEIKKDKSPAKIADSVAQNIGISTRDLSTVFMFLTGQTIINYIKERKMMVACESILESSDFDIQTAMSLSGLGDQSAFIKVFKKQFYCTPKEAFAKKDRSIIKIRMTFDRIGNTEIIPITDNSNNTIKKSRILGVDYSKYVELKEIIELQDIYEFDELQSETAYDIYKTYDLPLKKTFRFVSEFHYNENPIKIDEDELKKELGLSPDYQFAPEEEESDILSREEFFLKIAKGVAEDPEIRYVYFNCDMDSIYTVYNVIERLHSAGETDATQVDIDVVNICAYEDIDVKYCKKAVKYYKKNATNEYGKAAFDEFIGYILKNQPIEIAFSNIYQLEGWDDCECLYHTCEKYNVGLKEYEPDDPFEKWAEEQTDYSDKYQIELYQEDEWNNR